MKINISKQILYSLAIAPTFLVGSINHQWRNPGSLDKELVKMGVTKLLAHLNQNEEKQMLEWYDIYWHNIPTSISIHEVYQLKYCDIPCYMIHARIEYNTDSIPINFIIRHNRIIAYRYISVWFEKVATEWTNVIDPKRMME